MGDVSVYLASNDNAEGSLFGKRLASPTSPVTIAYVTDALRWQNDGDPTDTTLRQTANYLIWLCGKYGQQASYIISGTGGGSVIPIPPGNLPTPLQFYVSAITTVATGDTSVVLSSFVGFNLLFTRNGIPQSTINTEPSYYAWNPTTGVFSISPAAIVSELFQIYAL